MRTFTKLEYQSFVEEWGQTTEEICNELGFDEADADEVIMNCDYFYDEGSDRWFPESSSLYDETEQALADRLR